jgi:hypothetical protein
MAIQRQTGGARRLSVVVPATDVTGLEETLISVLEHRPDNSEIVVALGSPYDDPWNIREEVTFVDAAKGSGLVKRRRDPHPRRRLAGNQRLDRRGDQALHAVARGGRGAAGSV